MNHTILPPMYPMVIPFCFSRAMTLLAGAALALSSQCCCCKAQLHYYMRVLGLAVCI